MIPAQTRCRDEELVGSEAAAEPAAAIVRAAQTWAHDNLIPLNASIETTLACNIRCVHCYNFSRTATPAARRRSTPAQVRENEPTTWVTPS